MPSSHQPDNLVRTFRRRTGNPFPRRLPLPRREKLIITAVAIPLIFVVWALGGVKLGSQYVLVVLSGIGVLLLFLPLPDIHRFGIRSATSKENLTRLIRFPIFWLGLLLLAYIAIQGINARWVFVTDGVMWWLNSVQYIRWLPSGIQTPIEGMNAWRLLMILASPWLMVCTVWVGLQHRRSVRILFWITALNISVWSALAIFQHLAGASKILGIFESPRSMFWGTIIYPNHAAALLNLGLVLILTLFLYHFDRSKHTLARSGPEILFLTMAFIVGVSMVMTLSRGGIIIGILIGVTFMLLLVVFIVRMPTRRESGLAGVLVVILLAVQGTVLFSVLDEKRLFREYAHTLKELESLDKSMRFHLNRATLSMIRDNWWWGWGGGSFRYYFPIYQRQFPELNKRIRHKPISFNHAHNDFLQFSAELGAAGTSLIGLMLLYGVGKILLCRRHLKLYLSMLLAGCTLVFAHAAIDFILYNPAILMMMSFLFFSGVKIMDCETKLTN